MEKLSKEEYEAEQNYWVCGVINFILHSDKDVLAPACFHNQIMHSAKNELGLDLRYKKAYRADGTKIKDIRRGRTMNRYWRGKDG